MRPTLHYTPARGWMNDPNGLIQRDGVHHLFYQTNPLATRFEQMHWGHAISTDLVSWTELALALRPGIPASDFDAKGCWSGAAIEVDGRIAIVYTGFGETGAQLPCLAWATGDDLLTFDKDPASPIIAAPPFPPGEVLAFRDHALDRHRGGWRQLVAGGVRSIGPVVFSYLSPDFRSWSYDGLFATGSSLGLPGRIWECPDLFRVGSQTILTVSTQDGPVRDCWWALGTEETDSFVASRVGPLDVGNRFYAPQSYWTDDGRRIMIGWLQTQADLSAHNSAWLGAMSLPRELTVEAGSVYQRPARELTRLREAPIVTLVDGQAADTTIVLDGPCTAFELQLDTTLANSALSVDVEFAPSADHFEIDLGAVRDGRRLNRPMTIYFDRGIIEVFADGRTGSWSHSALHDATSVVVRHRPGIEPVELTLWPLRAAGPTTAGLPG